MAASKKRGAGHEKPLALASGGRYRKREPKMRTKKVKRR
jgi:hypothetical protein